jgi:hypothetical protein
VQQIINMRGKDLMREPDATGLTLPPPLP